jgi:para-nitrobenzyl esterase
MRRLYFLSVFLLLIAACSGSGDDEGSSDPPAQTVSTTTTETPSDPFEIGTDLGVVVGAESDVAGVRAFLTIPFAAPPTGENRWRMPQPHEGWDEPLDATSPGPSCPQPADSLFNQLLDIPESDEDCLTLNVWSPEDADGLPVMVWIHGGGLSTGSAHQPYYIGDQLAGTGIVVVSMNYRLGALGFLATDELADEGASAGFGNYGLADQAAALEWTQRNIAAFGGDPEAVTIVGESAGGFSVCGHLASPASAGLFRQASILSGGGCNRLRDGDDARRAGQRFMEAVGCDDLGCLRSLPVDELLGGPSPASLVDDGITYEGTAYQRAVAGDLDIPLLIGSNADEATLFTLGRAEPTDDELLELVNTLSADPAAVLALYPADAFETNLARYQAISTDAGFTCPGLGFAQVMPRAYVYHYAYVSAGNPLGLGATHGAELAFLFGHPEGIRVIDAQSDAETDQVSNDIQAAWSAFVKGEAPTSDWPLFAESGQVMVLDAPFRLVDQIRDGRCDALGELIGPR